MPRRADDPPAGLDRLVHEPARLLIMTHLAAVKEADFVYLLRQTGLTRGNLSTHLTKLEEGGYVAITKTFEGKVPRTVASLTKEGKAALTAYSRAMRDLLP
jgi:DNA-binding MarR family transcriptional regulator